MPESFSPALAARLAQSRLRTSRQDAIRRGDFYAARQLQKREVSWRAAEKAVTEPRDGAVSAPVLPVAPSAAATLSAPPAPPVLQGASSPSSPPASEEGRRALDDLIAIVASEYRRRRDQEAIDECYREEWIRAGCPATLHEFAQWKSSNADMLYDFQTWLRIKERERSEAMLARGGIHHPSPLFETLRALRQKIEAHGLVAECHKRLQEVRGEDRRAREAEAHSRIAALSREPPARAERHGPSRLVEITRDSRPPEGGPERRGPRRIVEITGRDGPPRPEYVRDRDRDNDRGGYER